MSKGRRMLFENRFGAKRGYEAERRVVRRLPVFVLTDLSLISLFQLYPICVRILVSQKFLNKGC